MNRTAHPPLGLAPAAGWRRAAAHLLFGLGRGLVRAAHRLVRPRQANRASAPQALEFYAEAGAPEGALYADGRYVGSLHGVTRL